MKLVIFDKIVIENEIIKAAHGGKFDIFIIKDKEDALNAGSNYIRDVSEKMYNTYIDIHLSSDTTFVEISDNDYIKLKLLHGNGDNIRVERISTSICKPICKLDLLLDNTFSSIVENMIRYSKIYLELLSMENDSREEYRDIIFSHSEIKPVDTVKQRIGNVKCKYIYDEIIKNIY